MRVIVYGKPHNNSVLASFIEGCKALGHDAIQRNHSVFTPDQTESADMVAVYGWQGTSPAIAKAYEVKGVRCVVMDAAYICRDAGYHAVGIGGLNQIPATPCPPDRMKAWGSFTPAKKGTDVLIVGQVQGDAQLPPHFDPKQWAAEAVKSARDGFPGCRVVWKPHPRCEGVEIAGVDEVRTGPLADALNGCQAIITYNSTSAYEAMLRGVKAICDPSAVYAFHLNDPQPFLQRVAYGQWTKEEIANGSALRFLIEGIPNEQRHEADAAKRHEGTSPDASRNAEAARGNDEGRKPRRKKGVR